MEYYSIIKKEEILPFSTTWIDLGGVMLRQGVETWEMGEGGQKVQTFSYKINNSWGYNI